VFSTERWDVGPGETSSFPTKWMSADGQMLHLVFSGDDYFSVRQATLNAALVPRMTGWLSAKSGGQRVWAADGSLLPTQRIRK